MLSACGSASYVAQTWQKKNTNSVRADTTQSHSGDLEVFRYPRQPSNLLKDRNSPWLTIADIYLQIEQILNSFHQHSGPY